MRQIRDGKFAGQMERATLLLFLLISWALSFPSVMYISLEVVPEGYLSNMALGALVYLWFVFGATTIMRVVFVR